MTRPMHTTVVVVPRERFTSLPASLSSLFRTIDAAVPVVVVEGGSPDSTRAQLGALQRQRPFTHIASPYMLKPNEARNRGVAEAATEYVVIADNDIEYEPGWLDALERHALEHGSDVVAPLICIGPPSATTIHHAGGMLEASRVNGSIELSERHRLMEVPLAGAAMPAVHNQVCEFHCAFVRRSLVEQQGGLDERLVTREQIDFVLRGMAGGVKVTFAQDSVVTYMARDRFVPGDLRYHLFRWSDRFVVESLDAFESTWGVALDRDLYRFSWTAEHRLRAGETTYPRLRRALGRDRFQRWVVTRLEERVVAEQARARNGIDPTVPPSPPRERVDEVFAGLLLPAGQEAPVAR